MNTWPMTSAQRTSERIATLPRPGVSTLLTVGGFGFNLSTLPRGAGRDHAFRARLFGGNLLITRGVIDGAFEPLIGGRPMSQTLLPLDPAQVNERGESWACVEVEARNAKFEGVLNGGSRVEAIHTKEPHVFTPEIGRGAFAQILWIGRRPARVEQIWFFNPKYEQRRESATFVRHLFL